jgi:hypothetical protein
MVRYAIGLAVTSFESILSRGPSFGVNLAHIRLRLRAAAVRARSTRRSATPGGPSSAKKEIDALGPGTHSGRASGRGVRETADFRPRPPPRLSPSRGPKGEPYGDRGAEAR